MSKKSKKPISPKKILIFSSIFFSLFLMLVVFLNHLSHPTTLDIFLSPTNATLTIKELDFTTSSGLANISAGTYTASISATGFQSETLTITIHPHIKNTLNLALKCAKDIQNPDYTAENPYSCYETNQSNLDALKYVHNHSKNPSEHLKDFVSYQEKVSSLKQKLPIRKYYNQDKKHSLSFQDLKYTIITDGSEIGKCKTKSFCLIVFGTDQSKNAVQALLEQSSFNINDFEIIYDH